MSVIGQGQTDRRLQESEIQQIVSASAEQLAPDGKSILVIIPDATRTCPIGMIARHLHEALAGRAKRFDFLIALGTHPPMSQPQIDRLLDVEPGRRGQVLPGSEVFNHHWDDPQALATVGTLSADRVAEITGGKFALDIDVTINKKVLEYDTVLIAGPVFPHEVVGFSGGSKYFFPASVGGSCCTFSIGSARSSPTPRSSAPSTPRFARRWRRLPS